MSHSLKYEVVHIVGDKIPSPSAAHDIFELDRLNTH